MVIFYGSLYIALDNTLEVDTLDNIGEVEDNLA
jgi:hypothetical protein